MEQLIMSLELDLLEKSIIESIVESHLVTHAFLRDQVTNISVKCREYTGIGIYIHFAFDNQQELPNELSNDMTYLGSEKIYQLDTLKYPISFELNLTKKGLLDFLEIVRNGDESWDGTYGSFSIR